MKRFVIFTCIIFLMLIVAAPVTAARTISSDTITAITPSAGQTGKTVAVTITGNNFTNTMGTVRLEKSSDQISATISSWTTTQIECSFKISSSKDTGDWDLIIVKGFDSSVMEMTDAFTIRDPMKLTAISPKSGRAGDDDVDFTITGSNLEDVEEVFLSNTDYDYNITADDVDAVSSTKVTGTFDIEDVEDFDTFDVCVEDSDGAVECALSFEILTNEAGSLDISSDPSGASILIDGIANGTTPNVIDDLMVGSYKVILRKTGYAEWGKIVNIEADETYEIDAKLYAAATATPTTTVPPVVQTTAPVTTARTTAKTTIKVPTSIPTATPTPESTPLEPVVVIAAAGIAIGLSAIRRL